MEEIIKHIQEESGHKKIQSCCKKILKKCSFRSANDIANVTELAYWLYICGNTQDAAAVCGILEDVEFSRNYTLWDKIDSALCLKARICREQGNDAEREALLEKVNAHRNPELYQNTADWSRGTLNENIAGSTGIMTRTGWLMTKLMYAIRYREAGGHPIPDQEFEKDIQEVLNILRTVK